MFEFIANAASVFPERSKPDGKSAGIGVGWLPAALIFGLTLHSVPANAAYEISDEEYRLLPAYCHHQNHVSARHRPVRSLKWEAYLGNDFLHVHHWCIVYVWMMRAYKVGPLSREGKHLLVEADHDATYFITRMRPDSPLAAEAYSKRGEVYLLQRNYAAAEVDFMRARQINPAKPEPYFWWARFLFDNGKRDEALATLDEGLKHAPNAKSLKSLRETVLTGKKAKVSKP